MVSAIIRLLLFRKLQCTGSHGLISSSALACSTAAAKLLQSCPTLCDPIDGSPPGSPVPGILLARVLERGAIAFSGWRVIHNLYYVEVNSC